MNSLPKFLHHHNDDIWLTENERENLQISYRIKEVVFAKDSQLQHVMILDSYDFGRMLVLDGVVQTTSIDGYIYNEMISHIPLNFHPNPRRVLIIGGGDCGAAREVTKYEQVETIDLVEIDELVVKACKEYLPEVSGNLSDPRVRFIYQDGVEFVKNLEAQYDVIIVDSSDPIGPAKQLFELSFYQNLHRALKPDGLMVCQSQSPIFHADIMRQTYQRVSQLFPITKLYTAIVPTYPGGLWSFTLGSKIHGYLNGHQPFDKDTRYVNEGILNQCFELPEFVKKIIQPAR
ncbi:polyamine aminopropyltransferase [Effusibacillus pohliae]|uniref:polyamine aminopropyltransferase n=1 Tax=Effusibacillus pohliae TaxID=232270 RepID=UPI00036A80E1|nr:polyamine aminopropyltransferase [Effusibacillus pohliae]